jgi:hypothetical protein
MTSELQVGIGDALATDYFFIRDQLTADQLDYLTRARQFVDDEVLPHINEYWAWSGTVSRATAVRRWTRCPPAW